MATINSESLDLLEFDKIKKSIADYCFSYAAKQKAFSICVFENRTQLIIELQRTAELKQTLIVDAFFPSIECPEFRKQASLLG